jgi:hypothetical protein
MIVLADNGDKIDVMVNNEWFASFKDWPQAIYYQHYLKNGGLGTELDRLGQIVANIYGHTPERLKSKSKLADLCEARVVFSLIARYDCEKTFKTIGAWMKRDHSTIMHHFKAYQDWKALPDYYSKQLERYDACLKVWRGGK